eukprot:TRINITY_DN1851_c0_g1_i13.p1 TRINITY_DN1851_c0_g1~~TRINITY_DN1851_c0_g1_i13.p1  ORF type:complete len:624 (+),score=59.54 TRINITY_DN1851_c0_g1_i13:114-1985(+)
MGVAHEEHMQHFSICGNLSSSAQIEDVLQQIRSNVIGGNEGVQGPWGRVPLVYADYTASGRLLQCIENFMQQAVYPFYANTHTDTSECGARTNYLYHQAREIICNSMKVSTKDFAVIFTGSGCTGAISKLISILGINYKKKRGLSFKERPVVFIGPYEHHSNEVMWRECKCDVVTIREDTKGKIDLKHLTQQLQKYQGRKLKIGSFSAGSNVTGIASEVDKISEILRLYGALACFDYAGTGAYMPIDASNKDAIYLSPHKFIGGPGSSGILVLRRSVYNRVVPSVPAGGTVSYVSPRKHWFVEDIEAREEGGTPPILQAIRAALVIRLKQIIGNNTIVELEDKMIQKVYQRLEQGCNNIFFVGSDRLTYWQQPRVSIFSFLVPFNDPQRPQCKALHHNFVAALLNDLYGIQSRSGCFCAGPYGHRLFDTIFGSVDSISAKIQPLVVNQGFECLKWGWVRINLNYFISEAEANYILDAISQVCKYGYKLLPQYSLNLKTGIWRHRKIMNYKLEKLSLTDFGTSRVESFFWQEKPVCQTYSQHLQIAQFVYSNADKNIILYEQKEREIERGDIEGVRWFPLPAEVANIMVQGKNDNFKYQLEKCEKQCKKGSGFRFQCFSVSQVI